MGGMKSTKLLVLTRAAEGLGYANVILSRCYQQNLQKYVCSMHVHFVQCPVYTTNIQHIWCDMDLSFGHSASPLYAHDIGTRQTNIKKQEAMTS